MLPVRNENSMQTQKIGSTIIRLHLIEMIRYQDLAGFSKI